MAQKVNIVLVDDIDGSEATETVVFGLDGTSYEIDLNDEHAAALREAVAAYVGHGRRVAGSAKRGRKAAASSDTGGIISTTVDGQSVTFENFGQLQARILFWEKKVALLSGARRRTASIRTDSF